MQCRKQEIKLAMLLDRPTQRMEQHSVLQCQWRTSDVHVPPCHYLSDLELNCFKTLANFSGLSWACSHLQRNCVLFVSPVVLQIFRPMLQEKGRFSVSHSCPKQSSDAMGFQTDSIRAHLQVHSMFICTCILYFFRLLRRY